MILSDCPLVYIIIINWNGLPDTIECLESLSKIDYKNYKIIVVDNASNINEIDYIKEKFPETILFKNDKNLGFSGGNNIGIKYAIESKADYVLLLNNDTVVDQSFLTNLVAPLLSDTKISMAVPKINYYSNPQIVWYAGGWISKYRGSGFTIGEGECDNKYMENKFVSFATGCCLLIRTDVIKKIDLLDERYFLYLEDADYCLRNILAGYKILFIGNSKIYHKVSISTKRKDDLLHVYYVTRNRLFFIKKFFKYYFFLTFGVIIIIFIFKSIYWILTGDLKKVLIVKESVKDFLLKRMGINDKL